MRLAQWHAAAGKAAGFGCDAIITAEMAVLDYAARTRNGAECFGEERRIVAMHGMQLAGYTTASPSHGPFGDHTGFL